MKSTKALPKFDFLAAQQSIADGVDTRDAVIDAIQAGPPKLSIQCALPTCKNRIEAFRSRLVDALRYERNVYCSKSCNAKRDRLQGSGVIAERMREKRRLRIEARNAVRAAQEIIRKAAQGERPSASDAEMLDSVAELLNHDASTNSFRRSELT